MSHLLTSVSGPLSGVWLSSLECPPSPSCCGAPPVNGDTRAIHQHTYTHTILIFRRGASYRGKVAFKSLGRKRLSMALHKMIIFALHSLETRIKSIHRERPCNVIIKHLFTHDNLLFFSLITCTIMKYIAYVRIFFWSLRSSFYIF